MKIKLKVPNKIIQGEHCQIRADAQDGTYEVEPFKIVRVQHSQYFENVPAQYDYVAHFIGVDDMKCHIYKRPLKGEECEGAISRRLNPEFNPGDLEWIDNVAVMNG